MHLSPQRRRLDRTPSEMFWRDAEQRLRWRFVFAKAMEALRVPLLVVAVVGVSVGLALRQAGVDRWTVQGFVLVLGLSCCWRAVAGLRNGGFWREGLFPRMDERLGLHSRLCAAAEGVGLWPDPVPGVDRLWSWRAGRAFSGLGAWLFVCAFLALAPEKRPLLRSVPVNRPPVVAEAEELLAAMESNEALEEEAVKELREELERMKGRDAKEWFSQGGLEAAAQLMRELEQGGRELAAQMERIQDALQDLASGQSGDGERVVGERLSAALRAASGTKPGLDKGLEQMLKQLAEGGIKSLSAKEFKEMQNRLNEALKKMGECGLCRKAGTEGSSKQGERASGIGPSEDAASDTPLTFSPEVTRLEAGVLEALPVAQADRAGAVAGDVLREVRSAPQAEPNGAALGPAGGRDLLPNAGGSAAWRSRPVPPDEALRLRRYFSGKRDSQ